MSDQTPLDENERKLAFLLQTSLDFAFGRMSEGKRLIPFATRMADGGNIDFVRLAGEETTDPLGEIYDRVEQHMAALADAGGVLAAALVAPVQLDEAVLGKGFYQAIRVHVETPDFVRLILQPFRIDAGGAGEKSQLALGKLVTTAAEHAIFGTDMGDGQAGRTIFSLT